MLFRSTCVDCLSLFIVLCCRLVEPEELFPTEEYPKKAIMEEFEICLPRFWYGIIIVFEENTNKYTYDVFGFPNQMTKKLKLGKCRLKRKLTSRNRICLSGECLM